MDIRVTVLPVMSGCGWGSTWILPSARAVLGVAAVSDPLDGLDFRLLDRKTEVRLLMDQIEKSLGELEESLKEGEL